MSTATQKQCALSKAELGKKLKTKLRDRQTLRRDGTGNDISLSQAETDVLQNSLACFPDNKKTREKIEKKLSPEQFLLYLQKQKEKKLNSAKTEELKRGAQKAIRARREARMEQATKPTSTTTDMQTQETRPAFVFSSQKPRGLKAVKTAVPAGDSE